MPASSLGSATKAPAENRRSLPLAELSSARFVLAALGAVTIFSVFYQQRWGTIADTSWLITVCERVLAGERLYVDLIETNPPFSVWLYMPPVALANALGVRPEILVHAWTYIAAITGLVFAGVIVRRARFPESAALFGLAPVFYALLVIMPGNAFSQREHIAMALFLPLLALTAWRARGDAVAVTPTAGIAALAGLCGSVLVLVKPYYALMVLAPALFVALRQRSVRPLLAPEYWAIGAACAAYLALVAIFHREFISDIYPMVAETYVQVSFLQKILSRFAFPYAVVMALIWWLSRLRGMSELSTVATLASLAGIVCLVHQGKGFAYHGYPALFCALVALCCLLALPRREAPDGLAAHVPFFAAIVPVASLLAAIFACMPFRATWKPNAELVQTVKAAVDKPTVAQIGSDLAVGHPFSRLIGGRWVSAYSSDWPGTFALILRERAGSGGDADRYLAIADDYTARKRSELDRLRPDLILTQNNDIFWHKIMADSDGLAPFLEAYRPLAEDGAMRILIRKDYRPPAF